MHIKRHNICWLAIIKTRTHTVGLCSVFMFSFVENTDVAAMATAPPPAAAPAAPAATGPPTGHVVGDLNDPEYLNWYKANRTLNVTIDVLRQVCLTELKSFHKSLLKKHTNTPCSKPCTYNDIVTRGKVTIPCPSNVCPKWISDIISEKTNTKTRLTWQNSEFPLWQTEPWQIAKIYMDKGQDRACIKPDGTDAAGIVQLLLNNKRFTSIMDTKKVDDVSICSFVALYPFLNSFVVLVLVLYESYSM